MERNIARPQNRLEVGKYNYFFNKKVKGIEENLQQAKKLHNRVNSICKSID